MINKIYNGRIIDTLRSILFGCALAAGMAMSNTTEAALAFLAAPGQRQ